ncbi:lariat debranching enzyme [Malassezia vespertilionis]|uniref:lariat debranching enzyme n=1 Tax=Malassezia vespertilionis TaxID=2020962 RepID=UPI0024B1964D|nr:lariat debranching enzyme [Malassezia vespertilionis]WFD05011.1 lariat debranching enzyme [Malassezia vespertilionis]
MRIAVEGCSHGELDVIYDAILAEEQSSGERVDVVLLCGDFQAIRNATDLESLAVPLKYRRMGDFHRYYAGEKTAPILTLVIGGNHEASNYMWELYYGGWLAPNIYYLGAAGSVDLGGIVVAGASGIFKRHDYTAGRFEHQPYSPSGIRSVYHTRQFDIIKLGLLQRPQIFLSHDWPNGIEHCGDVTALLRKKPFFREEVATSTLGSPPLQMLLDALHPAYWFSAHLHVRFAATVYFGDAGQSDTLAVRSNTILNPEVLEISDEENATAVSAVAMPAAVPHRPETTQFLALNKCSPRGDFLHFFTLPTPADPFLHASTEARPQVPLLYNKRWLAITRVMDPYFSLQRRQMPLPSIQDPSLRERICEEEARLDTLFADKVNPLDVRAVQHFQHTAPASATAYTSQHRRFLSVEEIAKIRASALERRRKRGAAQRSVRAYQNLDT